MERVEPDRMKWAELGIGETEQWCRPQQLTPSPRTSLGHHRVWRQEIKSYRRKLIMIGARLH